MAFSATLSPIEMPLLEPPESRVTSIMSLDNYSGMPFRVLNGLGFTRPTSRASLDKISRDISQSFGDYSLYSRKHRPRPAMQIIAIYQSSTRLAAK